MYGWSYTFLLEYQGIWVIWENWPACNIIKIIDLVDK